MKTVRNISSAIAAITLMAAVSCQGQDVRITSLDTSSGQLGFTLIPAGAASNYSCSVEWRSILSAGNWTNSWHQPFAAFSQSNGVFYAALPRFFRISCVAGQTTNTTPASYTVTGIVPSQIENGMIRWTNTNSGLIYYVEQAISTNGPWQSQWAGQTNIHTTVTVTNAFSVPMFFRVVTIVESGELPW